MRAPDNETPDKAEWRRRLTATRAALPPELRAAEAEALAEAVRQVDGDTVCAYVPFGTEPGSTTLLAALADRGTRVLLPVIPDTPGPLDWACHDGRLVPGRLRGVLEPAGPRLGPAAMGAADAVLVPALAVDEAGVRLGRGAGFYDRSLGQAAAGTPFIAVVRDDELVERLPADPHDVPMSAVLTPGRGLVTLGS